MKKTLLAFAFCVFPYVTHADHTWQRLTPVNSDIARFIDTQNIEKTSTGTYLFWIKQTTKKRIFKHKTKNIYAYTINIKNEMDCNWHQYRQLEIMVYSKAGNVLETTIIKNPEFEPADYGMEQEANVICGQE